MFNMLLFLCLELNDSVIEQPWYREIAKIEIGNKTGDKK